MHGFESLPNRWAISETSSDVESGLIRKVEADVAAILLDLAAGVGEKCQEDKAESRLGTSQMRADEGFHCSS